MWGNSIGRHVPPLHASAAAEEGRHAAAGRGNALRANILCAGLGTRLRPLTYIKPKPLLSIGGYPLVERTIRQLRADGVDDIALVVGYKRECFEYLRERYGVQLIVSERYDTANNFSSLELVADRLGDSLVIDGDLYIRRPLVPLVRPGVSQFITQRTERGREWELITDDTDRVVAVKKDSPDGYAMSGVSYWTEEAAALLRQELARSGPDDYWEDAAIRILDRVPVYATRVKLLQCEIDSLDDVLSLGLLSADELADQCSETALAEKLKGLTNDTYLIRLHGKGVVLRIPGRGTDQIIDRTLESAMLGLLDGMDITPRCTVYSGGIKTTDFLEEYAVLTPESLDESTIAGVAGLMRRLHAIPLPQGFKEKYGPNAALSVLNEVKLYERQSGINLLADEERRQIYEFAREMDRDEKRFCHRDFVLENILRRGESMKLIDFEYACFCSPYWDYASFVTETRLAGERLEAFVRCCGMDRQRLLKAMIIVDYIWGLWGFYRECIDYGRGRIAEMDRNLRLLQAGGTL